VDVKRELVAMQNNTIITYESVTVFNTHKRAVRSAIRSAFDAFVRQPSC